MGMLLLITGVTLICVSSIILSANDNNNPTSKADDDIQYDWITQYNKNKKQG